MENKQYESPKITVISIEPDEKLMDVVVNGDPGVDFGFGSQNVN